MKVYNVIIDKGSWDDAWSWSEGIYSTREKAEQMKKHIENSVEKFKASLPEKPHYSDPAYEEKIDAYYDALGNKDNDWMRVFNDVQIHEVELDVFKNYDI